MKATECMLIEKSDWLALINEFTEFKNRVLRLEKGNSFRQRVLETANGKGVLNSAQIRRLMGWGYKTFFREVHASKIPVTKNGTYRISVDDFMNWFTENYDLTTLKKH